MNDSDEAPHEETTETENTNDTARLPEVLTVDEVAELLRVNRKTVYSAIQRGKLPARRLGTAIRISRDQVLRWLADGQAGVSPATKGRTR